MVLIFLFLAGNCIDYKRNSPGALDSARLPENLLSELASAPVLTNGSAPLRKFPYPYRAMLSITSDCDVTTTETFAQMHRFLNTFEQTKYGPGLGLDIADSFFMYNGSDFEETQGLMSYCQGTDPATLQDAALIKKYYDCGWIDSIHAFGEFSHQSHTLFSRTLAQQAWELLNTAGIAPSIWIDHGTETNVQNFGSFSPFRTSKYQAGDNPKSQYYHTDITLAQSIRYIWHSRHSDKFGTDFPLKLKKLRDRKKVWSFSRYTNTNKNNEIDWTWYPNRLHDQLTAHNLEGLIEKNQYSIIGQHITQREDPWGEQDIEALRQLSDRFHKDRSILVARTSRLLDYALVWKHLQYQTIDVDGFTAFRILSIADPVEGEHIPTRDDLAGITFYCANPARTVIFIGDTLLTQDDLTLNPPDETGKASITMPWFPPDTTDYTQDSATLKTLTYTQDSDWKQ